MDESEKYRAPALDKGLDILELLASSPFAMSQTEIARALKRTSNEIYRMLDTLVRRNYITRVAEGEGYTLSLRLLILANIHPPRRRLLDIADPLLRQLSRASEQSCHLAVWEDGDIVITSAYSAPGNWRLSLRIGAIIGLFNTGSGQIISAFQKTETRMRMLSEHNLVEGEDQPELNQFCQHLDDLQSKGCSVDQSQTVRGAVNISLPILEPSGNAIAALTVPFLERIDDYRAPNLDQVVEMCRATASDIAQQISGV